MSIEERAEGKYPRTGQSANNISREQRLAYIQGAEDQKELNKAFVEWLSENAWVYHSEPIDEWTSELTSGYKTYEELYEMYDQEMNVFTVKTVERETSVPKEQIKKAVEEVYKTKKK